MVMRKIVAGIIAFFLVPVGAFAEDVSGVSVGVATVLTGDAAIIGDNIQKTIETYEKRYLRHPIKFKYEDAKKSSVDGLAAYRRLIEGDRVSLLIGGTTSNGTLAAAPLINKSKTVLITPLTGGSNIDSAGPYIFRIGNSDILNGYQQADLLLARGFKRVALVTEQTEYTTDISKFFKERFLAGGGQLVVEEEFLPDTTDFRSLIVRIKHAEPQALFMSTQTGVAFGIFVKQLQQLRGEKALEVHTNFLSADNPDAQSVAEGALKGVHYMAPAYDQSSDRLKKFLEEFKSDHGALPAITFHTAGTVDALDMLQLYLDTGSPFDSDGFRQYLLTNIRGYAGLMGTYSFDSEGNADIGFLPAVIP